MTTLLYALHSGNLYGTERMALATAQALGPEFRTIIIAPEGPVHAEARRLGFETIVFRGVFQFLREIRKYYAESRQVVSIGTRVVHSVGAALWERLYWRTPVNLQVVHGGADELLSYRRKRLLRYFGVKQVAVSNYVRERLLANGSTPGSVSVIENFLTDERANGAPQRPRFTRDGVRRVLVVSRLDPIKRVDLLMDAIDCQPALRQLEFRVLGSGSEEQALRRRSETGYSNVHIVGFSSRAAEEMVEADLLLHLCPEEPFGLVILEAMAARLPVLVADAGGAAPIVEPGVSGMHFHANDPLSLATQLQYSITSTAETLNQMVDAATLRLNTQYSAEQGAAQYRQLIKECRG